MIQIALCDDEKQQRSALRAVISTELDIKGIDYKILEYSSGEELCAFVANNEHDIIFLDIEMKLLNGIETAKLIRKVNKKAEIVFVTAYSDYVFQGYEVRALNYILKPYKRDKIAAVLAAALEQLYENQEKYFTVELKSGCYKINFKDILYFYSDKRKINIVTQTNSITFYDKLDSIIETLPKYFTRIHQRYIVNLNYVTAIEMNRVSLATEKLPVSRVRYQQLMVDYAKLMLN